MGIGDLARSPKKGTAALLPHFLVHVFCGLMVEWIKMPLGTKVSLGPGHIVLSRGPGTLPKKRGTAPPPHFSAHVYCGQMVANLSNCGALVSLVEMFKIGEPRFMVIQLILCAVLVVG